MSTSAGQVLRALAALEDAGCRVWLAGEWGVDALVGRQTREHRDLDLLVDAEDEEAALAALQTLGYAVETDWRPVRVELAAAGQGWVDVHPVVVDERGDGVQAGLDGAVFRYPAGCLTTGRIEGRTVGCLTAWRQRQLHSGYPLRDVDRADLAVLQGLGEGEVTFRPLRRSDFPVLARWLEEPVVARWWCHETTPEALERDFGPAVDGLDPTEVHVALADGEPFGLVQRYEVDVEPSYRAELEAVCEVPPGALSVDYLVGVPALRGCGLGARMIAAYVADAWQRYPGARDVLVPVAAGNTASWRALERAGFVRVGEGPMVPDNPIDPPDHAVYQLHRPTGAPTPPG